MAAEVIGRYGTLDNVLQLFAPAHQQKYTMYRERCYFGLAPTLNHLRFAYGDTAPVEWLSYQIIDLNRFVNCKTMTDYQVHSLAGLIAKEYYYLKLTEMMDFFVKVKSGYFGQLFFGGADPMPIMIALRQFAEERVEIISKKEQEDAQAEREKPREGILKPHEVQALRERLQAQWAEEEKEKEQ